MKKPANEITKIRRVPNNKQRKVNSLFSSLNPVSFSTLLNFASIFFDARMRSFFCTCLRSHILVLKHTKQKKDILLVFYF